MPKPTFFKFALAVVVILTVAGVGYVGLVIWRNNAETETQGKELISEAEPAEEKIYRNEEFGFEVKYPPELKGLGKTFSTYDAGGIRFRIPTQDPSDPFPPHSFTARRFQNGKLDQCLAPSSGWTQTHEKIGGVPFTRSEPEPFEERRT